MNHNRVVEIFKDLASACETDHVSVYITASKALETIRNLREKLAQRNDFLEMAVLGRRVFLKYRGLFGRISAVRDDWYLITVTDGSGRKLWMEASDLSLVESDRFPSPNASQIRICPPLKDASSIPDVPTVPPPVPPHFSDILKNDLLSGYEKLELELERERYKKLEEENKQLHRTVNRMKTVLAEVK